jgi:predicted 3-demethylubiquinone-9 3-methyltransferase (glyoxalase superfamily)
MQRITPCLWFEHEAEEAARHYVSIFPDGRIVDVQRYGEGAPVPVGTVLLVMFELHGQEFMALNGGEGREFSEAISLHVSCRTQEEVDALWSGLLEGGEESQCGWLKDRYGVSWQVIPEALPRLLGDPDPDRARRVMEAMFQMKKIDIKQLEDAHAGA